MIFTVPPHPDPDPSAKGKAIIVPGKIQCWRVRGYKIDYKFCEYIPKNKRAV